nr:MAG TPA: hypothetical protein [Caudoviricetes sp.]DAS59369.1 MAG TPA: hypothetical protein [Caudoviricetes sp.]
MWVRRICNLYNGRGNLDAKMALLRYLSSSRSGITFCFV